MVICADVQTLLRIIPSVSKRVSPLLKRQVVIRRNPIELVPPIERADQIMVSRSASR